VTLDEYSNYDLISVDPNVGHDRAFFITQSRAVFAV